MTRVILTNKHTGQELPEAELVHKTSTTLSIRFDGVASFNSFYRDDWDYREVRQFRNGDVLRRKDRSDFCGFYVYTESGWGFVNWSKIDGPSLTAEDDPSRYLNHPKWEVV